ncbi:hypothetical protein [Salipiger sp.]|uniref:hypothetical protein n=1 Tax=Salipiger sp. TaxID=2078585 RepID=UPI003A977322
MTVAVLEVDPPPPPPECRAEQRDAAADGDCGCRVVVDALGCNNGVRTVER